MKTLPALALFAVLTCGCATSPQAKHSPARPPVVKGPDSYHPLADTASPRGTYLLAWGIHGQAHVDWKRLEKGDDAYLDSLIGDEGQNVRDYLVNRRSKAIVGTLEGVRYFRIGDRGENHGSLNAAWTSNEQLAVVVHGGKWTFQSFDAVTLRGGRLTHQNDIGKPMTVLIKNWLSQHQPVKYPPVKDRLVIDIVEPVFQKNSTTFTAEIIAGIPKAETGFSFEGKGTFKLEKDWRGRMGVTLISIVAK